MTFDVDAAGKWFAGIVAGLAAGGVALYSVVQTFKKDRRADKQDEQIDTSVQQIITTLRAEVDRLARRVADMESELVKQHEINKKCQDERFEYLQERAGLLKERALLIARLEHCEANEAQTKLL